MEHWEIQIRKNGNVAVLKLIGRLIIDQPCLDLRETIRVLRNEQSIRKFVLNLSKITYIDSSGQGELVKALGTARGMGENLVLSEVPEKIQNIIDPRILQAFELYLSDERAVEVLQ